MSPLNKLILLVMDIIAMLDEQLDWTDKAKSRKARGMNPIDDQMILMVRTSRRKCRGRLFCQETNGRETEKRSTEKSREERVKEQKSKAVKREEFWKNPQWKVRRGDSYPNFLAT